MAGVGFTLRTEGTDRVLAVLGGMMRRMANPRPAWDEIGETMKRKTTARIASQNAEDPIAPWEPHSERYRRSAVKRAHHPDEFLILYGDLIGTLAWQPIEQGVQWGSPTKYGAAQEFGRPEINLPGRPFLGMTPADDALVLEITRRWLAADFA